MVRAWLLLLAVVAALWWLLGGRRRRAKRPGPRPAHHPASGGHMVRDRVCGTFVPQASALVHRHGGEEHYFCSQACLDRFLAAK